MAHRSSGRRNDYTWLGQSINFALASDADNFQSLVIPNQAGTLVRTRGEITASIDGPTDGDKVLLSFGIMVMSDDQVAAGVAGMPKPFSDSDADWLWHAFMPLIAQAAPISITQGARLTVDSKAMRRFRQNDQFVLVVESTPLSGTPVTDVLGAIRILFAA